MLLRGGRIDAASNDWRTGIEHEMHARTHVGSERIFLPIFIISVFRKFGRVAQHRSRVRFPAFATHVHAHCCPEFPKAAEKIGIADGDRVDNARDSRRDTRRSRSREMTWGREKGGGREKRIAVVIAAAAGCIGNCDFLRNDIVMKSCCVLPLSKLRPMYLYVSDIRYGCENPEREFATSIYLV